MGKSLNEAHMIVNTSGFPTLAPEALWFMDALMGLL